MHMFRLASVGAALAAALAAGTPARGQAAHAWGAFINIDLTTARFEPRASAADGFGGRGWGFGLGGAAVYKRHVLAGGDFGYLMFKDDSTFTETTNVGERTSSTNSFFGSIYSGLLTSPLGGHGATGKRAWLGVNVGYSGWHGKREIATCTNCTTQDVDIRGGLFAEGYLIFGGAGGTPHPRLRITYRAFLADDSSIRNTISLGMATLRGGAM